MDLPGKSEEYQLRIQEVFHGNENRPIPEFRHEAARLALTSGRRGREIAGIAALPVVQVANDSQRLLALFPSTITLTFGHLRGMDAATAVSGTTGVVAGDDPRTSR